MLAELQRAVGRALAGDPRVESDMEPALALLRALPRLSAAETLELYCGSIEAGRQTALAELYPVCNALVGEACFFGIGRALAGAVASRHPDLGRIGEPLPEIVETEGIDTEAIGAQIGLDSVPYLADVARLERAWNRAFVTAQAAPEIDPEAVGRAIDADPSSWRFRLPPSASLVQSRYPILAIWAAHQPGVAEDALARVDLAAGPDRLIVWRRGLDVCIHRVDPAPWFVLLRIEAGLDVARILGGDAIDADGDSRTLSLGSDVPDEEPPELDTAATLEIIAGFFERGWIFSAEPVGVRGG